MNQITRKHSILARGASVMIEHARAVLGTIGTAQLMAHPEYLSRGS